MSKNTSTTDQSNNIVADNQSKSAGPDEQPKYIITVVRKWATELSTIAEIRFGETGSGYTLEPPGPDTVEEGQNKRIPEDTYDLKWHDSAKDSLKSHNPLPQLISERVPEGREILIHNGNYPKNTEGCLLAGSTRAPDYVGASVDKLKELQAYLHKVGIENCKIVITSDFVKN